MRALILTAAVALLLPTCACGQAGVSASADSTAIHDLLGQYAKAVDSVDLKLLAEIWSHSPDVSFIYPLGEEHGFEAIEQHVFQNVMGGMFSARDLKLHDVVVYVNGASAWSEFHWDFHATLARMARRSPRMASNPRFTERKRESGASSTCTTQRIASQ
jgi:hypothetical protein